MKIGLAGFAVALFAGLAATAQQAPTPHPSPLPAVIASHPEWPKANPDDVKSPEAIVAALSDAISGEGTKPRDWNRVKSLFVPGMGRLITVRHPKAGPADMTVLTLEDYQARAGSQTFYEKPMAYEKQSFGSMTHVYESYGIFPSVTETKPQVRGVNSWELFFDGMRYWILQVYWDTERPGTPLPANLSK